ncbi:hypothetical protein [Natranaerobius thermophilus]|uniref:hypothetical protein n=1 Tax=Natranaerobius thermophilus TaxID=375929 RepID=UPI00016693C6|nr:hypothetical protein [Natranaerobius thermophilus]
MSEFGLGEEGNISLPNLEDLSSDFEKAEYLQKLLVNRATKDGPSDDEHYKYLRKYFLKRPDTKSKLPDWVKNNRTLDQYWHFIKNEYDSYQERRVFIWNEFSSLIDYLETHDEYTYSPHAEYLNKSIEEISTDYIIITWQKALERKQSDPDGAITSARTLLESVFQIHIR